MTFVRTLVLLTFAALFFSCTTTGHSIFSVTPDVADFLTTFDRVKGRVYNLNSDISEITDPSQVSQLKGYFVGSITGKSLADYQGAPAIEVTYHLSTKQGDESVFTEVYYFFRRADFTFEAGRLVSPGYPFLSTYKEVGSFSADFVPMRRMIVSGKSRNYYAETDMETVAGFSNSTFGPELQFRIALFTNIELPKDDPQMPTLIESQVTGYFQFPDSLPLYFGAVQPRGLGRSNRDYKTVLPFRASLYGTDATSFAADWQKFVADANFFRDKAPRVSRLGDVSLNLTVAGEDIEMHPEVKDDTILVIRDRTP